MFALFFALIGGAGRILKAIPPVVWLILAAAAVVLIVGLRVQSWAHGKDVQIERAYHAFAVRSLDLSIARDLAQARINEVTYATAIGRQNAAVTALGLERDRTVAALAAAAQRARVATASANRSAAALLAGHAGSDPCQSALGVARSLP